MTRFPDWQLRWEAFAQERSRLPFAWGSNDCATFAADAVQALTGDRLMPHLRDHCTAREAIRRIEAEGGLQEIATQALGESVPFRFARVGDVVLVKVGKRDALGICNGGSIVGPGPHGLVAVGRKSAVMAWRVG